MLLKFKKSSNLKALAAVHQELKPGVGASNKVTSISHTTQLVDNGKSIEISSYFDNKHPIVFKNMIMGDNFSMEDAKLFSDKVASISLDYLNKLEEVVRKYSKK